MGQAGLGAVTKYDWYVIKNCPNKHHTTVKDVITTVIC